MQQSECLENTSKLENSCQGLRVRFFMVSSTSGSLFTTVIVYSGLSKDEMPQENLCVCHIPGLTINAHIYIRNNDPGYVCFMQSGCKKICFFNWYEKVISIPTINTTRLRFQGFGEEAACNVSTEHNTVIWGDSDIPYLQQLSDLIRKESSVNMGILHCKIGAQITDKVQPMDVDAGFKVMKLVARTTISMGHSNSLSTYVYRVFSEMHLSNKLKLVSQKELIITDYILSTPEVLSKSYSKERIEKSYVDTRMLD